MASGSKFAVPSVELNVASLSDRERQVLSLAAAGFIDKQIGEQLGISLNTLRTYWTRIRAKGGDVPRAALAVAFAASESREAAPGLEAPIQHEGWVYDVETGKVMASDTINKSHGLECGVLHEREDYSKLFHPEDRANAQRAMDDVLEGREETTHFRLRLVTREGIQQTYLTVHGVKDADGKLVKVVGYRARVLDWEPEQKTVKVGFMVRDIESSSFWADPVACEIYGVPPEQATEAEAFAAKIKTEDRERMLAIAKETLAKGLDESQIDHRIVRPDGSEIWARIMTRLRPGDDGRLKAYNTVLAFDMTPEPQLAEGFTEEQIGGVRFFRRRARRAASPFR